MSEIPWLWFKHQICGRGLFHIWGRVLRGRVLRGRVLRGRQVQGANTAVPEHVIGLRHKLLSASKGHPGCD